MKGASPGARPSKGAFPRRNRIISGLSVGLVVVEAAERSGTLITVNCALEQGRDVYAIPGPIDGSVSKGTNRLIRDGAVPVLDADDLPVMLGLRDPGATRSTVRPPCTLSPDEALVFGKLNNEPLHLDGLAVATGLPVGTLLGVLLGLELGGLTEQLPGGVHAVKLKARC